jgi:hypothetical protein
MSHTVVSLMYVLSHSVEDVATFRVCWITLITKGSHYILRYSIQAYIYIYIYIQIHKHENWACFTIEGEFRLRLIKIDADRKEHITLPLQPPTCTETPSKESSTRLADMGEEQ